MRLSCINIPTPNAKRLANFYKKILGANIDETHGGPERIEIWFGNDKQNSVLLVATQDLENLKQLPVKDLSFTYLMLMQNINGL